MKTSVVTNDHLILDHAPWGTAITLIFLILASAAALMVSAATDYGEGIMGGIIGLVVFGVAFLITIRRVQLILDFPSGSIELKRRSMFGTVVEKYNLRTLTGVELESVQHNHTLSYRVVLVLSDRKEHVPLTISHFGRDYAESAANSITDWLQRNAR